MFKNVIFKNILNLKNLKNLTLRLGIYCFCLLICGISCNNHSICIESDFSKNMGILEIDFPYDLAVPTQDIYPKDMNTVYWTVAPSCL